MSNIKLTYFNLRGRAELARLILAQAEVEYEDKRIQREEWPTLKQGKTHNIFHLPQNENNTDLPFGQLPALEIDGKTISQSMTIARYLAKR